MDFSSLMQHLSTEGVSALGFWTVEEIAELHSGPNPRFLRRIRFFANRLWPLGYVDLQNIEPALKSSNLGREASFAIPSV